MNEPLANDTESVSIPDDAFVVASDADLQDLYLPLYSAFQEAI